MMFLMSMRDGAIDTNEALLCLSVYVVYVSTVTVTYIRDTRAKKLRSLQSRFPQLANDIAEREDHLLTDRRLRSLLHEEREIDCEQQNRTLERESLLGEVCDHPPHVAALLLFDNDAEVEDVDNALSPSELSTLCSRLSDLLRRPIQSLLFRVIPSIKATSETPTIPLLQALKSFGVCIFGVSLLSALIVWISESLVSSLGVGTATLGATLVALGSEVQHNCFLIGMVINSFMGHD
jgi:Ca2+/Na+ antiporter